MIHGVVNSAGVEWYTRGSCELIEVPISRQSFPFINSQISMFWQIVSSVTSALVNRRSDCDLGGESGSHFDTILRIVADSNKLQHLIPRVFIIEMTANK
jgi:hypothetical protein